MSVSIVNPVVCKVGGALLDKPDCIDALMHAILQIQKIRPVVLVHGGGNGVESLLTQLGHTTEKYQGLRVTPDEQMPIISGALAGTANKRLCADAKKAGLNPVGLSLFDGSSVQCEVMSDKLHAVGQPTPDDPTLLNQLLSSHFFPIISSIGCDHQGRLLNVNADQAATAIAALLSADLYLLSDVDAVLDDQKRSIQQLDNTEAKRLIDNGAIQHGMLVKVLAAQKAATDLSRSVIIGSWTATQPLIAHATQQNSVPFGTEILPVKP
ncbi:acetylglutamate kinase [Alteromonas facilis]|uniref:acetylglutamate kinase n=1 Tax=Alteromonas facilis TaxID=2048004 RepID=UPI000C29163D|nr:acetylglutamate kinase [Alteromonas facilis]